MMPRGHVDVLFEPGGTGGFLFADEIDLIVLNELAHDLDHRRGGLLIGIHQRLYTYIYNRTLTTFLLIVNPADDGDDGVHEALVVHAVFAMEMGGLRILLMEQVIGVDCCVFITEEPVDTLAVLVGQPLEALF